MSILLMEIVTEMCKSEVTEQLQFADSVLCFLIVHFANHSSGSSFLGGQVLVFGFVTFLFKVEQILLSVTKC